MDEYKHSSKASGATPAGALMRPHGGNFTHSRIEFSCRGVTHPYTYGRPLREGEGDCIALYKQRLQRATGLKPSKGTNALPPAWQFSLSWGGASAGEEHRVLGRHGGRAAQDAGNSPQTARVQRDALLASFLLASPPPKTTQGSSWRTAPSAPSPREQPCCRGGDDAKNSRQTWRQLHGQAPPSPSG